MTRSECLGFGTALLLHAAALAWVPLSTSGNRPADNGPPVIQAALIQASAFVASAETPAAPHRPAAAASAPSTPRLPLPRAAPAVTAAVDITPPAAPASAPAPPPPALQGVTAAPATIPGGAVDPATQAATPTRTTSESMQTARPDHAHNPPAEYPALARRYGLTGRVMMRVLVEASGEAREVVIVASSGHELLDQAALKSVRGWRFLPAKNGTQTVAAWVEFPVRFELTN